jgi:hypothetical protein
MFTLSRLFSKASVSRLYSVGSCNPKDHNVNVTYRMFILQAFHTSQCVVPRGGIFSCNIHGVHYADLSDFSVSGTARRHFSRQVAQLFRRKFRR